MIAPISRLELYNPADASAQPIPASAFEENGRLTLAELYEQVREVEIDYDELVGNVNAFFAERDASNSKHPSIGEILDKYPATQGIASIAGLMVLASDQASGPMNRKSFAGSRKAGDTFKPASTHSCS